MSSTAQLHRIRAIYLTTFFVLLLVVFFVAYLSVPADGAVAVIKAALVAFNISIVGFAVLSIGLSFQAYWKLYLVFTLLFIAMFTMVYILLAAPEIEFAQIVSAVWEDVRFFFIYSMVPSALSVVMQVFRWRGAIKP